MQLALQPSQSCHITVLTVGFGFHWGSTGFPLEREDSQQDYPLRQNIACSPAALSLQDQLSPHGWSPGHGIQQVYPKELWGWTSFCPQLHITESHDVEVGRDLWSTCGPTPWLKAGSARAGFSRSYPEGSWLFATSVGNLCLCSITLAEKKCLLMFRLSPWSLVPSAGTTGKSLTFGEVDPQQVVSLRKNAGSQPC